MWLITTFGFFSVVQKPGQRAAGTLTVRGRVRADLEALRDRYLPAMGLIEADVGTDYKYRAVAPAAQAAAAMCAAVADIDYSNFKDAVAAQQGKRRSGLYHELWDTLWKLDGLAEAERTVPKPSMLPVPMRGRDPATQRDAANRFVDTEQDLPCWGIPVPNHAKMPTTGGMGTMGTAGPDDDEEGSAKPTAFGGVVFDSEGRVLLRKPTGEFDGYAWTFPKGRPVPGESADASALREVQEETGVEAAIVGAIPGIFRGGTSQTRYFRMTPVRDSGEFDPAETENVRWAEPDEARHLIAQTRNAVGRERDLDVLAAALASANRASEVANNSVSMQFEVEGPPIANEGDEIAIGDTIRFGDVVWFDRVAPGEVVMRLAVGVVDGIRYQADPSSKPGVLRLTALR